MGPTTLPDGVLLAGTYRITGLLGSGGFANTYAATDLSLSRDVAIKEFFPAELAVRDHSQAVAVRSVALRSNFEWARERFVREARALAKFRHPNIVRVFNVFDANNTSYMVLEFVRGMDMAAWLRRREMRPSQPEFDHLIDPLLDALEAVHATGMLHRDIKPENIYIRDENLEPVLLDFGAAKFDASERQARTTAAIVSSGYSPNEAYTTDKSLQGPWTDVYSLAATVYHALTGKPPPEAVQRAITDSYVPLASSAPLRRAYRPTFLAAIDAALAVRPKARPQTIDQWRRMLHATVPAADQGDLERPTRVVAPHARTRIVERASRYQGASRAGTSGGTTARRWLFGGTVAVLVAGAGLALIGLPFATQEARDDAVETAGRAGPASEGLRSEQADPPMADTPGVADPEASEQAAPASQEQAGAGKPETGTTNADAGGEGAHGGVREGVPEPAKTTSADSTVAAPVPEPVVQPGLVPELGLRLRAEPANSAAGSRGGFVSAHFQGTPGDRFKVPVPDTVARIVEIVPGTGADGRGLRAGDVVVEIAGVTIDGPEAAQKRIAAVARLGQREVVLSVLSGQVYRQLIVPLGVAGP